MNKIFIYRISEGKLKATSLIVGADAKHVRRMLSQLAKSGTFTQFTERAKIRILGCVTHELPVVVEYLAEICKSEEKTDRIMKEIFSESQVVEVREMQ